MCVAFIPLAIRAGQANLDHTPVSDFPATSFLTGRVTLEPSTANGASGELEAAIEEAGPAFDEMRRRLAAEPGVLGVTLVTIIPGLNHPTGTITIEGNAATSTRVRTLGVDSEFFEMMGTTLVGGRLFRPEDATTATCSVVVERGWATSSAPTRSADASAIPMKMTRRSAR